MRRKRKNIHTSPKTVEFTDNSHKTEEVENINKTIDETIDKAIDKSETTSSEGAVADDRMLLEEDIRIQRAEWIMQQLKEKNQKQTEAWMKTLEAQRLVNQKSNGIYSDIEQSRRMQKYQEEMQQDVYSQVYQMHGVSEDKLQGIYEYKNAKRQGIALAEFFVTAILLAACVYIYGFSYSLTLLLFSGLAVEGALLPQKGRRSKGMEVACFVLYLLVLPILAAAFVVHEMAQPQWYAYTVMGIMIAQAAMLVVATVSYFVYNPYRADRKNAKAAKKDLRKLEKIARQNVAAKEKARIRQENKEEKKRLKEEKKALKKQEAQERREAKIAANQAKKEARAQEKLAKKQQNLKEKTIESGNEDDKITHEKGQETSSEEQTQEQINPSQNT